MLHGITQVDGEGVWISSPSRVRNGAAPPPLCRTRGPFRQLAPTRTRGSWLVRTLSSTRLRLGRTIQQERGVRRRLPSAGQGEMELHTRR